MPHVTRHSNRLLGKSSSDAVITSRENRWLKRFRAALAGERSDDGIAGVEGVRLVEAALGSGVPAELVLLSESGARHFPRVASLVSEAVPVLRTTDKLFAAIADTQAPQGIAALVRPRHATIEQCLAGTALVVVLVGVQDPGNVGTIVRTAEALGATGVVTCSADRIGTADPFAPKALRASAGSALRLPIVRGVSATVLLAQLRMSRASVYAAVAATDGPSQHSENKASAVNSPLLLSWDIDWKSPAAILIGNEGSGLPLELVRSADARVYIPQVATTAPVGLESLNAAMAAGALLYEAMRQRNAERGAGS